jgi:hypothetical protein
VRVKPSVWRPSCHLMSCTMVKVGEGALHGAHMRRFLAISLNPGASDLLFQHATGVVCNCTQVPEGRALLMEGGFGGLAALVDALSSASSIKRRGAAAAIKNLALAAHQDGTVDRFVADKEVLRKLLV